MERNNNVRVARLLFGEPRYAALLFALAFLPAQTLYWPRCVQMRLRRPSFDISPIDSTSS
jgi:hypothetical protein